MPADSAIGQRARVNPWPDLLTARLFLNSLVVDSETAVSDFPQLDPELLANWLIRAGLGALTFQRYKGVWPDLAERVRGDYYQTALSNSLHMKRLRQVADVLIEQRIPYVLLKGAALSYSVYDRHIRPMSDVDLWVRREDFPLAAQAMTSAGLRLVSNPERPFKLKMLADIGLGFLTEDGGLVEVHCSPYPGWWLQRTADVDNESMWQRIEPLSLPESADEERSGAVPSDTKERAYCLDPEDTILQLAVHAAVNHQFGVWGIRSIVDVSMVMNRRELDWQRLVQQARRWRLATALWTVLHLQQQLVGTQNLDTVLTALQPRWWRRTLLTRVVGPQFLLDLRSLGLSRMRFTILLLLTDRFRDAARLVWRTFWPERAWLDARYGTNEVSYAQHLWNVLRHGVV